MVAVKKWIVSGERKAEKAKKSEKVSGPWNINDWKERNWTVVECRWSAKKRRGQRKGLVTLWYLPGSHLLRWSRIFHFLTPLLHPWGWALFPHLISPHPLHLAPPDILPHTKVGEVNCNSQRLKKTPNSARVLKKRPSLVLSLFLFRTQKRLSVPS